MKDHINILVVDDDPIIIKSAWRSLEPEGYNVEGVLSGREAMDKIEHNNYDLVVTDLMMPGIDGITFIRWLRQFRPAVGIVVVTGHLIQEMETIKEAHKLGIITHMRKPFTPAMLKDVVKETLAWLKECALEPVTNEEFPAEMLETVDKVISQYKGNSSQTIRALLHAQDILGYLPAAIQKRIARGLDMYPSEIHSIVSFYPYFRTKADDERVPLQIMGSQKVWRGMPLKRGKKVETAVNEFIRMRQMEEAGGGA
ncbi:MAG: response regulator [Nitrospirae bacterium]|nr:response regulator [Nitrospirota bacterium]